MNGVELIAAERQRQVETEGWTTKHDDKHVDGSLAQAAACYAQSNPRMKTVCENVDVAIRGECPVWKTHRIRVPAAWPWSPQWWKPKERVRDLVRAGALIAAEIDRLQRLAKRKT